MYYSGLPKGQSISEYLFDNLKFSKKTNKKFDKFLRKDLKSGQIIRQRHTIMTFLYSMAEICQIFR